MISADVQGRNISVQDVEKASAVIKHKPDNVVGQAVIQKLDADNDGSVEIEHVLGLVLEEGGGAEGLVRVAEIHSSVTESSSSTATLASD